MDTSVKISREYLESKDFRLRKQLATALYTQAYTVQITMPKYNLRMECNTKLEA